ncbi:MAG: SOS response-associated peptidase, partial [Gemmatimonadota bacterium]
MCGRFTLSTPAGEWAALFDVEALDVEARYNIAPTDDIVVVRPALEQAAREAVLLRWGLIPGWTESPHGFPLLINARSETIGSKPSFKDAFRERRCLVVADGFSEWKAEAGRKRPYWIH